MRDINLLKECMRRRKGQEMKIGMKLFFSSDSSGVYAEMSRFVDSVRKTPKTTKEESCE